MIEPPRDWTIFDISVAVYDEEGRVGLLYLHECGGYREFAVRTGPFEWAEVDRLLKRVTYPRPLIHDTVVSVIKELNGEMQHVSIVRLDPHDYVYYALFHIRTERGTVLVDVKPSDAIIMAIHTGTQILVSEDVLRMLYPT